MENLIWSGVLFIMIILSLIWYETHKENKNLKLSKKDCIDETIPVIGSKKITQQDIQKAKYRDLPDLHEILPPRGNSGTTNRIIM